MTITSVGYQRAINYAQLGTLLAHAGAQYSVFGVGAFDVLPGPGTREVLMQPGRAYGQGIVDESDAVVPLVGNPVSSGSRWDMVVLRRNWIDGTTTPVLIQGGSGSTPSLPARETTPGALDDQPIALVRFNAGQSQVQDIVGLQVWHGDGGCFASSPLVRDYLTRVGTRLYIADRTYVRVIDASGTARWVTDSVIFSSTQPTPADVPWLQVP